jgi:hypothetical protein
MMVRLAKRLLAAGLGVGFTAAARAAEAPSGTVVYNIHHEKYGEIGTHTLSFAQSGGDLTVDVENKMKVKVLFITVFRYKADRKEVWRDGRMVGYRSQTHDDGTDIAAMAELKGDKLVIEGPNGRATTPLGVFPTNPWNSKIVEQSLLMDTKTGELLKVKVTAAGEDTLEVRDKPVKANKYVISGELERELWFAEDGTWLQMRFDSDGSAITFTLR